MAVSTKSAVAIGKPRFVARTTDFKAVGDVGDRTFQFLASDSSVDRMGDTIAQDGWDLSAFKANPVILYAHNQELLPLGQATKLWVDEAGLHVQIHIDDITQLDKEVCAKLQAKTLRAVSVGFIPREYEWGDTGANFTEQELCEITICPVPANAHALAEARTKAMATSSAAPTVTKGDMDKLEKCVKDLGEHAEAFGGHIKSMGEHMKALEKFVQGDDATTEAGKAFAEAVEKIGLSPEHKAAVLKASEQSHAMHPDVAKCVGSAHKSLTKALTMHNGAASGAGTQGGDDDEGDDDDKKALADLIAKNAEIDAVLTKLTGRVA